MIDNTDKVTDIEDLIERIVYSVDTYNWIDAYIYLERLEKIVNTRLILWWGEIDSVSDYFYKIRRWLKVYTYDEIKAREIKETLVKLLKKISKYGIISIANDNDVKDTVYIKNIINIIDELMLKQSYAGSINNIKYIKKYISTIEKFLMEYHSEDKRLMELSEFTLNELRSFLTSLSILSYSRGINMKYNEKAIEKYNEFRDALLKFIRALELESAKDSIVYVYETTRGVTIHESTVIEEVVQEVSTGEKIVNPEFDWVDEEWDNILQHPRIYLIIGRRGGGKSCLGYAIMEYLVSKYNIKGCLLNVQGRPIPHSKLKLLPNWVQVINDVEDAPNNCVLLVDEAYLRFHARRSSVSEDSITMDSLINLSRQKYQSQIYITQQTDKIDKNIASSIDVFLVKIPSEFQLETERRGIIQSIINEAYEKFKKIKRENKDVRKYVYVVADTIDFEFKGIKTSGMPSFWSEGLSTFYMGW